MNKKPLTIFLDMDGVLSDLNYGIAKLNNGIIPEDRSILFESLLPEYVKINGFANERKFSNSELLVEKLHELQIQGIITLAILTSAGSFYKPQSQVVAQKKMFIERNFPILKDVPFCVTSSGAAKSLFANEHSILIDDTEKNVVFFNNSGGTGILYTPKSNIDEIINKIIFIFNNLPNK